MPSVRPGPVQPISPPTTPGTPSGTANFFCVPGIGGSVLQMHALAQRVGSEHRLIALRTGSISDATGPKTVEELAARSIETVLRRQASGPYLLGGYSGGAMIAFEMARQLTAMGREVGLLALIDTRRPGWRMSARTAPAVTRNFLFNLPGWVRDDLAKTSVRQTLKNVRRHMRQLAGGGRRVDRILDLSRYPVELQRHMECEFELLDAYRPEPWRGAITLFRARTQPLYLLHDERGLGWSALAGGGIKIVTLPGNHLTIMREPYVAALAAALRQSVAAALGACPAAGSPVEPLAVPISPRDQPGQSDPLSVLVETCSAVAAMTTAPFQPLSRQA